MCSVHTATTVQMHLFVRNPQSDSTPESIDWRPEWRKRREEIKYENNQDDVDNSDGVCVYGTVLVIPQRQTTTTTTSE